MWRGAETLRDARDARREEEQVVAGGRSSDTSLSHKDRRGVHGQPFASQKKTMTWMGGRKRGTEKEGIKEEEISEEVLVDI